MDTNKSMVSTLVKEPVTFLGGVLLFLMAFSPAYNMALKIVLIGILLVAVLFSQIFFDRLNLTKAVLLWYFLFVAHSIIFTAIGLINRNNTMYVLKSATYNIIWPIVYLLFTVGIYKKSSLRFLIQTIAVSNIFISLYLIGGLFTILHILPPLSGIDFSMSSLSFDTLAGLLKIESPAVICLLFTMPFIICVRLTDGERTFGLNKLFISISILITIVAVLATARRALILNIFLSLPLTFIFVRLAPALNKRAFNRRLLNMLLLGAGLLTLVIIIAEASGLFNFSLVYEKFISAFSSRGDLEDVSTSTRYDQFELLVKSWLQKPLIGFGHGAVSRYIIRSYKTPWIYELSYVALLFQTGVLGLSAYLALLAWPIYKGIQIIRKANTETCIFLIPCLVGCACFLIANATNPYLQSYDYMWTLFFPVAVINYFLKTR